jgi:hypothetical protein
MKANLIAVLSAAASAALIGGCGPSDQREYREAGDTPRAAPATVTTPGAPADSTTGVARSSGRPGVAGDTISRSSKVSP